MNAGNSLVSRVGGFVHHNLLWFLLGSYALAGFAPDAGLWLRGVRLAFGSAGRVSLPALMLSVLLFNAGLGVEPRRLRGLVRGAGVLLAGLAANVAVPLAFILGVSLSLGLWHNPAEVQSILVGLALVAAMPIAGSSTAWSQNADGDLALSLRAGARLDRAQPADHAGGAARRRLGRHRRVRGSSQRPRRE